MRRTVCQVVKDHMALVGYLFLVAVTVGSMYFAYAGNRDRIDDINREGAERRDQTCRVFETQHKGDVDRLRDTYSYLTQLTRRERQMTLNRFILGGLAEIERAARVDTAPAHCDERGFGLPEPDPVIPERPPGLFAR